MQYRTGCPLCVHFGEGPEEGPPSCSAFPEGIPNEILHKAFDHRQEFPGDQSIRFTARDPQGETEYDALMTRWNTQE